MSTARTQQPTKRTRPNEMPQHLSTLQTPSPDNRRSLLRVWRPATGAILHFHAYRRQLDDFGTGYLSPSYLRRVPFGKIIKNDRCFVSDIATSIVHRRYRAATPIGGSPALTGLQAAGLTGMRPACLMRAGDCTNKKIAARGGLFVSLFAVLVHVLRHFEMVLQGSAGRSCHHPQA
jgi:hypothetical protein